THLIPLDGIDVRLVDRYPEAAEITQGLHHIGHIARKEGHILSPGETAALREPERLGKMMQGDDRDHTTMTQVCEHGPVTLKGGIIPLTFDRFYAAPFQAQT